MTHPITLWLSDEEFDAFEAQAERYGRTVDEHALTLLAERFAEAGREYREATWVERRKALEKDPQLAATVDAALKAK